MNRTILCSVCSVLSVVVTAPVAAQDTLPDIVITATRTPLPREAVTASVTVLDGAALRARGLTTVADALRDLSGAAVVRTGSYGAQTSLFLRGGESNFTQVLVDGVPVNDPGGSFDFATLSLDGVARIEVLRGPASVLYGSDAVSGVVHVITAAGRQDGQTTGSMTARYGTYQTLDVQGSVASGAGPFNWRATAARSATDGIHAFNSQFENLVAGARAGFAQGGTTADLSVRYADGTFHFPTDFSGVPVDSNQFQTTETATVGLDLGQRFSPRVEARVLLGFNRLNGGTDNQPDAPGDALSISSRRLTRRSADARVNLSLNRMLVTVGSVVEGEHEQSASQFLSSFGNFASDFDETRRNVAGYAQLTGHVGGLAVSAGGRVDANERFGTFVTGRGGLAYRFATGTRVRGTAGTGFKEPTFFENFGGSGVVGNLDLEPERSFAWEVGAEQPLLDGRLRLEATWFMQRFEDLIEFIGAPPAGDPNYVNVAAARADGVEFTAMLRLPAPGSRVSVSYAYLVTEVTAAGEDPTFAVGEPLARRPGHRLTARVVMTPVAALQLSGGVRYTGTRADLDFAAAPPRVTLPAHALVDLAGTWQVVRGVSLEVAVQNVLDTEYEEVLGFATPGRVVLVGGRLAM